MHTKVVNNEAKGISMDLCGLILKTLTKKSEIKSSEIVALTGFSRAYVNRAFQKLRDEGKILLIGKANAARYILATELAVRGAKKNILKVHRIVPNKNIAENLIFEDIKKNSGIFINIPENVSNIVSYAFMKMLNNAIEHSQSKKIKIVVKKDERGITFQIIDKGMGIFNNIMRKKSLADEMDAIQALLKGKVTTLPEKHTGEGIFFTSKAAGIFIIQSSHKKVIFNGLIDEIFIKDIKNVIGTKINFSISLDSKKELEDIFRQYTDDVFGFSKTKVTVKLYRQGTEYISRSQARRILVGLEKFKTIMLDFKDIKVVGQGFADEVFRVWKARHPEINIIFQNADANVSFMIKRACSENT